jgi:hypothetical protein
MKRQRLWTTMATLPACLMGMGYAQEDGAQVIAIRAIYPLFNIARQQLTQPVIHMLTAKLDELM